VVHAAQGASLGAGIALRHGVLSVSPDRNDLVAVDCDDDAAGRQTYPAETALLWGHCDIMTPVTDRDWIEPYFAAWESNDPDAVVAFMTDDVEFEDVTAGHKNVGQARVRRFVAACFEQVPGVHYEVVTSEVFGDAYFVEWVMQPMGLRGASVGKRRDGKIVRNHDYWNGAAFQIGSAKAS
jgi:uncharacterized protein (TIGR02246 family)